MKYKFRSLSVIVLCAVMCISSVAFDQPAMERARGNLQDAKNFLNRATPDKGGHRNRAIEKVNQAIAAVNSGIAYDRTHLGNRPRRRNSDDNIDLGSMSSADQPNMVKARDELQKALNNLNNATADKGGWRNKAIDLTKDAIKHVNDGIEYDRTH